MRHSSFGQDRISEALPFRLSALPGVDLTRSVVVSAEVVGLLLLVACPSRTAQSGASDAAMLSGEDVVAPQSPRAMIGQNATPIEMPCFAYYYGAGLSADLPRARDCFSRIVAQEGPCDGQSPDLPRVFLVVMEATGQGGPRTPDDAGTLLGNCFDDVSVRALRRLSRGETIPLDGGRTMDPCKDVPGTTYLMGECSRLARDLRTLRHRDSDPGHSDSGLDAK